MDIRGLHFLQTLLQTGSVTRTSELLGISQPAASRTLARIRDLTGDPLLIRTQKGYQLTDHACSLREPVQHAITTVQAVFQKSTFDPLQADNTFRVACTDYATACVLGPAMQRFETTAPSVKIDVIPLVPDSFSLIDNGEIDFALFVGVNIKGDYIVKKLFDETYSLVMRQNHPLVDVYQKNGEIGPDDTKGYRQIEFAYPTQERLRFDPVMRSNESQRDSVFSIPFFTAMPLLIGSSDAVAAIPTRLAELFTSLGNITTVPYRPDSGFPYHLIWHERARHNPATRWFVEQMVG
jgi:DNA-binding transcriptional LysR family regulator